MTVRDWEAKRLRESMAKGNLTPSLNEIILNVIPEKGLIKREEIIHQVSVLTGIDTDDLHFSISRNMLTLCEEHKVTRGKDYGYYQRQRTA